MKNPNGYGGISKLSGKRRNPYRVRITTGWEISSDGKVKQKYSTLGYYHTKADAMNALANYNQNPYDIDTNNITFKEVYEKWSNEYFKTIVPSAVRTIKSAYTHSEPLWNIRMRDIRVSHLEDTIANANVGSSTKSRMKSMYNLIYKYALKHEIVDKDYAAMCNSVKQDSPKIQRIPFYDNEINELWDNLDFPCVDMILIGIYSGWRPQELATLKVSDIDMEQQTMFGGMKTESGKNRIVPMHPYILPLIEKRLLESANTHSEYLFNEINTYDRYRHKFDKINSKFKMAHKPHDTRHTFITKAKEGNVNEYILKLIVGHAIQDITEKVYTHRTIEELKIEMNKIK